MSLRFQSVRRCVPHLSDEEKCQLIEQIIDECDIALATRISRKIPELVSRKITRERVTWLLRQIPNNSPIRGFDIWDKINHTEFKSLTLYYDSVDFEKILRYNAYKKGNSDWNWQGMCVLLQNDNIVDIRLHFQRYGMYSYILHGHDSYGKFQGNDIVTFLTDELDIIKKNVDQIRMIGDELLKSQEGSSLLSKNDLK